MKTTTHRNSQRTSPTALGTRAKCRNNWDPFDTDHTKKTDDAATESIQDAKAICRACPIAEECLRYALTHRDMARGVWAATTGAERGALRRRLKQRLGPNWQSILAATTPATAPIQ